MQLASLILQIHRRPKLLPPASSSLLYTLKSTISVVPFQIGCAAADCSKCCAGPRHRRQRGRQQLPVLGLACPLPSRSSSVLPSSLPLTFGHDDRDAQISSTPYRLGDALITMATAHENISNSQKTIDSPVDAWVSFEQCQMK